jgi:16S rRNA (adenine(1408)-N(1))-methyltransferase
METIRGKPTSFVDVRALAQRLAGYQNVWIDIGTGDGRFVRRIAATRPDHFVIGIDACRENLRVISRSAPPNALYVIANALALPCELNGSATHVTIHFPWGSLLTALLTGDPALLNGLAAIARTRATLEILLNGGALSEVGWPIEAGGAQMRDRLSAAGFDVHSITTLNARDLHNYPTTWARRLAFGRDPRALRLNGIRMGAADQPLPTHARRPSANPCLDQPIVNRPRHPADKNTPSPAAPTSAHPCRSAQLTGRAHAPWGLDKSERRVMLFLATERLVSSGAILVNVW